MEHPRCVPGVELFPSISVWDAQSLGETRPEHASYAPFDRPLIGLRPSRLRRRSAELVLSRQLLYRLSLLQGPCLRRTPRRCAQRSILRRVTHLR